MSAVNYKRPANLAGAGRRTQTTIDAPTDPEFFRDAAILVKAITKLSKQCIAQGINEGGAHRKTAQVLGFLRSVQRDLVISQRKMSAGARRSVMKILGITELEPLPPKVHPLDLMPRPLKPPTKPPTDD